MLGLDLIGLGLTSGPSVWASTLSGRILVQYCISNGCPNFSLRGGVRQGATLYPSVFTQGVSGGCGGCCFGEQGSNVASPEGEFGAGSAANDQVCHKHRCEVEFAVGDRVFLKVRPHRQSSVARHSRHKLAAKFYGMFVVESRVGPTAYRLTLPASSRIHPMFHVSQLGRVVGRGAPGGGGVAGEFGVACKPGVRAGDSFGVAKCAAAWARCGAGFGSVGRTIVGRCNLVGGRGV